jgi:hypothetical protein
MNPLKSVGFVVFWRNREVKTANNLEVYMLIIKSEIFYGKSFKLLEELKEKTTNYTIYYNKNDFKKD